jgi:enoyl-[acyl-carrier protein] reductase I
MADLSGKKRLVVAIGDNNSLAYGCAKAFNAAGAVPAMTYLNEAAEPNVRLLAEDLGSRIILSPDVTCKDQVEELLAAISQRWGHLHFLLHSIAYALRDDLHARVTDCSRDAIQTATDISRSFFRPARRAADSRRRLSPHRDLLWVGARG